MCGDNPAAAPYGVQETPVQRVQREHPGLSGVPLRTAVIRELLAWQVLDLLEETSRRLASANIQSVDDVRNAAELLVGFSPEIQALKAGVERFLRERVYKHHQVLRMTGHGRRVLQALFAEYVQAPEHLPEKHLRCWTGASAILGPAATPLPSRRRQIDAIERVVGDYLAGMTDRFAQQEFRRLFLSSLDL